MLKYCKVINEETKECQVGLGDNNNFYKSIGFEEKELVEVNEKYYLKGYEPAVNLNKIKEVKKQELKKEIEKNFYDKYPLYKQCNIAIFGTEEEKQEFKKFHDNLVSEYDKQIKTLEI